MVSDERLVDLLDLALSADTANTVKCLREVTEAGMEPMALMSQLATIITDILAGTHLFTRGRPRRRFFHHLTRKIIFFNFFITYFSRNAGFLVNEWPRRYMWNIS